MADIPEPWATALVEAGLVDPRGRGDRPSLRQLGDRSGIAVTTLSEMMRGGRRTRQENIDRVADALRVDPRSVASWVNEVRTEWRPYEPPAEANLLSQDERKAVNRIITLMARGKRGIDDSEIGAAVDGRTASRDGDSGSAAEPSLEGERTATLEDTESSADSEDLPLGSPETSGTQPLPSGQRRKGRATNGQRRS